MCATGPPEQFEAWLQTCSLEEKKGEISELLVNSPSIRSLYTKMVRSTTMRFTLGHSHLFGRLRGWVVLWIARWWIRVGVFYDCPFELRNSFSFFQM